MNRKKLIILVNFLILITVCGITLFFWTSTVESYNAIERNKTYSTLEYLNVGLNIKEKEILAHIKDYAWWDDSVKFSQGTYPEYPDDNFNNISLDNLDIHRVIITDRNGKALFSTGFDPEAYQVYPIRFSPDILSLLYLKYPEETRTIIVVENETPYMFCSAPILYTNQSGPVSGMVIFGRRIDSQFLTALEQSVHSPVSVQIRPFPSEQGVSPYHPFPLLYPEITAESDVTIENAFTILTSDNRDLIVFHVNRTKDDAITGREIISKSTIFLLILIVCLLVFMTIVLLFAFSRYERELHEMLTTIIRFYPDASYAVSRDGTIIAWNQALSAITGKKPEEMIGSKDLSPILSTYGEICSFITDCIITGDYENLSDHPSVIRHDDRLDAEIILSSDTGSVKHISIRASPIFNSSGDLIGAIEQFRDITDQKEAAELAIKRETEKELIRKNEELNRAYETLSANEEELRANYEEQLITESRLRESEARFRAIFSLVPDPIVLTRIEDGVIIDCNEALTQFLGQPYESIVGKTTFFFPVWKNEKERAGFYDALKKNGTIERNELQFRDPRGNVRIINYSSRIIEINKEKIILNVGFDLTDLKVAEQSLMESEEMFRNPVEQSPVGIFLYQGGYFRYVNPTLCSLFGYSREELLEKPVCSLFFSPGVEEQILSVIPTNNSQSPGSPIISQGITARGMTIDLEIYVSGMKFKGDSAISGTIVDISYRRRIEEERAHAYEALAYKQEVLKEREVSLSNAQAIAHLGNWEWKTETDQIYASEEFCRIFGLPGYDNVPTYDQITGYITPDNRDLFSRSMDSLRERGTPIHFDCGIIGDDGSEHFVRIQGKAMTDNSGIPTHISLIVLDITGKHQMEQKLLEAFKEKESLLREIHHRVKNNMQVISSLLSMQARTIQDEKIKNLFKETQTRVRSLALVHELLYQSDNLNKINYQKYLERIFTYLLQSYDISRVKVVCTIDADNVELPIDKAVPCSLVITELITNSIKYAFSDNRSGKISIRFFVDTENYTYTMDYQDNGPGFPDGFDPYNSPGFGSSLISGLIRQLSGELQIDGDNSGVHYRISFPCD